METPLFFFGTRSMPQPKSATGKPYLSGSLASGEYPDGIGGRKKDSRFAVAKSINNAVPVFLRRCASDACRILWDGFKVFAKHNDLLIIWKRFDRLLHSRRMRWL